MCKGRLFYKQILSPKRVRAELSYYVDGCAQLSCPALFRSKLVVGLLVLCGRFCDHIHPLLAELDKVEVGWHLGDRRGVLGNFNSFQIQQAYLHF